ncbi:MAG: glycerate kinase [Dermatophilaceae bacterium]
MPPRVLVACDKFKGSLTGRQVLTAISDAMRCAVPDLEIRGVLIADGGDGTLDAVEAAGFTRVPVRAAGPLGQERDSSYAVRDGRAVVEMADVCGLARLPGARKDPLGATSRGVGDVLRAVLDAGVREIVLGIGGSASTDGGAGMLQSLGARLLDDSRAELAPGGGPLAELASLDLSGLHPGLADAAITLASDVHNPLLGEHGAAAVFGPQKGASPSQVQDLDGALGRFAQFVTAATGRDDTRRPGAGAAGGVGYAAIAVLGARMQPGIDVILELNDVDGLLAGADLVVTGEGTLDLQTLLGKAPAGVARAAREAGVPVVALCARATLCLEDLARAGFRAIYQLVDLEPDPNVCMRDADRLLRELAAHAARDSF